METAKTNGQYIGEIGSAPSLIELFTIEGLYGYRTIGLESDFAATILIAKNGSGKTTLLGALDAFLKSQFGRLADLQFERLKCKLRGAPDLLCLTRDEALSVLNVSEAGELHGYARSINVDPQEFRDFLEFDYPSLVRSNAKYGSNEIFDAILSRNSHSFRESKRLCDRLVETLYDNEPNVRHVRTAIKAAMEGVEVVYLPTYRRIELPLAEEEDHPKRYGRKRQSIRSRLGISSRSLFNADIQFGLSDISERLSQLNQEILFNSNDGYREISANIINDLISGEFERVAPSPEDRPDKESLNLFFSRLKDGRRIGPFGYVAIPDIDKIYSGLDISDQSNKFLTYFLSKLNTVIKATRGIELLVEEFINNCNRYLSARDESVVAPPGLDLPTNTPFYIDDKALRLNRRDLQVSVESLATKRRISINLLSSGEKQLISLFALLYLYPGKKIILIDEPELSLSLDWQRKILLDVLGAPSCAQVIAITHSPFVFDNTLEPYAKSLSLSISQNFVPENTDEKEEGLNG